MLNGLAPIILFNFNQRIDVPEAIASIPLVADITKNGSIPLPPIPIYLSEELTGLYITNEDKNLDIQTVTETLTDGDTPKVTQKGIGSTVRVSMVGSQDSIGLTLILAMADLILNKCTSKEYSITYLHGATTIFNGLLHSFSVNQNANNTLYEINVELSKGGSGGTATQTSGTVVEVPGTPGVSL